MTATKYLRSFPLPVATADGLSVNIDDAMNIWVNHVAHLRAFGSIVHLVGNGGSASVVAHAQNDLRKGANVKALVHQDVPLLTAYANDHGYDTAYADALALWLEPGDMLIVVSSSGASRNMLYAAERAKKSEAIVVTCSGFKPDNPLRQLGDLNFYVPSSNYGQVERTHAALLHCLTDRLASK